MEKRSDLADLVFETLTAHNLAVAAALDGVSQHMRGSGQSAPSATAQALQDDAALVRRMLKWVLVNGVNLQPDFALEQFVVYRGRRDAPLEIPPEFALLAHNLLTEINLAAEHAG